MNKLKEKALNLIIEDACELFLCRSIADVTIKDIAEKAGIGEASVYRYFTSKKNIITRCAIMLQGKVYREYFNLTGKNGLEKIEKFYNSYLEVFVHHPEFYRFIKEFDACMLFENDGLKEYGEGLDLFFEEFSKAYGEGLKDGSVRSVKDLTSFYYATTHALLELCKKLSAHVKVLKQDGAIESEEEISVLISVILSYLTA